jgi:hypothetical protein
METQRSFILSDKENEKQESQTKRKKMKWKDYLNFELYIIDTNSRWKAIFDTGVLFVVAYSIFTTLLNVAFDPETTPTIDTVDTIVKYIFAADFILSKSISNF